MKIPNKIPNISGLVKKTALKGKTTEIEIKIPDIAGLGTAAALNAKVTDIENKIHYTSDLFKKLIMI